MGVLQAVWSLVRGFSADRAARVAENLGLRHQIAVLQGPGVGRAAAGEPNGRYHDVFAKATKCGGTDGRKSEHPNLPMKQGNSAQRTLWREGDAESRAGSYETRQALRNLIPCQRNTSG